MDRRRVKALLAESHARAAASRQRIDLPCREESVDNLLHTCEQAIEIMYKSLNRLENHNGLYDMGYRIMYGGKGYCQAKFQKDGEELYSKSLVYMFRFFEADSKFNSSESPSFSVKISSEDMSRVDDLKPVAARIAQIMNGFCDRVQQSRDSTSGAGYNAELIEGELDFGTTPRDFRVGLAKIAGVLGKLAAG